MAAARSWGDADGATKPLTPSSISSTAALSAPATTMAGVACAHALGHRAGAAQALLEQPPLRQPGEAERPLRQARAQPLNEPAREPSEAPEVLAPVAARPQLVPVDHQPEAPHGPCHARSEQRE